MYVEIQQMGNRGPIYVQTQHVVAVCKDLFTRMDIDESVRHLHPSHPTRIDLINGEQIFSVKPLEEILLALHDRTALKLLPEDKVEVAEPPRKGKAWKSSQ